MPAPDPCRRCLRDLWAAGLTALAISAVAGVFLARWIGRALPDLSALGQQ